jgi:hypothetical protein
VETSLTPRAKRFVNRIDFIETTPVLGKLPVGRARLDHGLQGDIGQRTIPSIIGQLDETIGGAESCVGRCKGMFRFQGFTVTIRQCGNNAPPVDSAFPTGS